MREGRSPACSDTSFLGLGSTCSTRHLPPHHPGSLRLRTEGQLPQGASATRRDSGVSLGHRGAPKAFPPLTGR